MSRNPAIEVDGVWKKFRRGELHDSLRDLVPAVGRWVAGRRNRADALGAREFWALKDINFTVERGEALGIIGPNGAGKSTLLKVLSRILRPNQGHYRVQGRLRALIEVAAGFHTDLTGRENIYLNGAILGMRKAEIDRRLDEIIDFSGIEAFIDTPVKRYSSGMQARLGFSVAAHMDPEVLLVDEVLSVGDAAFRAKCLRHMEQLIRSDVSVVFISHNLEQMRHLCKKAFVLQHGRMIYHGDVGSACDTYYRCHEELGGTDKNKTGGVARVLGFRVLDERGRAAFRIGSYSPLTIEVDYRLDRELTDFSLIMRFQKPGGTVLTGCSTADRDMELPRAVGTYSIRLEIDGLPFSPGDYLVEAHLVDREGKRLETNLPAHPLTLTGSNLRSHWEVCLRHSWHMAEVSGL